MNFLFGKKQLAAALAKTLKEAPALARREINLRHGLVFLWLVLPGCASPITSRPPSPRITLQPTAAPSPVIKSSPTLTTAPQPTATPHARPTSRPTPEVFLEIREPSVEQLSNYLEHALKDFYGWEDYQLKLAPEDINGDGTLDAVARYASDAPPDLAIVYADVSSDQQADLIVYGDDLIILVWADTHYRQPYWLNPDNWSRGDPPLTEVTFRDWTSDGTPEIVLDHTSTGGGTGLWDKYTSRSIIYCDAEACNPAWEGQFAREVTDYNYGGLLRFELAMYPGQGKGGEPILKTIDNSFYLRCCFFDELPDHTSLNILTSTLSIYAWHAGTFELAETQIVSLPQRIQSLARLTATSTSGVSAAIVAENNRDLGNNNDYCQLRVNQKNVGKQFGCRESFTRVEWKDITQDAIEEIIITAFSAGYPMNLESHVLSNEECMHQRLIAYAWEGETAREIANVAGCVIRKDLYGIRLEDIDQDGQLEILAAPLEFLYSLDPGLNNRAYKWNGQKFVLWSDIPLP